MIAGADGQVRGARVRKPGRGKPEILNRPIQKLFPLESTGRRCMESRVGEIVSSEIEVREENKSCVQRRPTHLAAKDERCKTQIMIDS